jgi:hypothetical protein
VGRARHSSGLVSFVLFLPGKSFPLSPSLSPTLAFGALSIPLTSPLFFLLLLLRLHFANLYCSFCAASFESSLSFTVEDSVQGGVREREREEEEARSKSFLPGVLPHTHILSLSLSSSKRFSFGLHHLQFVVGKRNWSAL